MTLSAIVKYAVALSSASRSRSLFSIFLALSLSTDSRTRQSSQSQSNLRSFTIPELLASDAVTKYMPRGQSDVGTTVLTWRVLSAETGYTTSHAWHSRVVAGLPAMSFAFLDNIHFAGSICVAPGEDQVAERKEIKQLSALGWFRALDLPVSHLLQYLASNKDGGAPYLHPSTAYRKEGPSQS